MSDKCIKCMEEINSFHTNYIRDCACDAKCSVPCKDDCKDSFCVGQCYCDKKDCNLNFVTSITGDCDDNFDHCKKNVI